MVVLTALPHPFQPKGAACRSDGGHIGEVQARHFFAPKKSVWRWLLPLLLVLGVAGLVTWKLGKLSEWVPFLPPPKDVWGEEAKSTGGKKPTGATTPETAPVEAPTTR